MAAILSELIVGNFLASLHGGLIMPGDEGYDPGRREEYYPHKTADVLTFSKGVDCILNAARSGHA